MYEQQKLTSSKQPCSYCHERIHEFSSRLILRYLHKNMGNNRLHRQVQQSQEKITPTKPTELTEKREERQYERALSTDERQEENIEIASKLVQLNNSTPELHQKLPQTQLPTNQREQVDNVSAEVAETRSQKQDRTESN